MEGINRAGSAERQDRYVSSFGAKFVEGEPRNRALVGGFGKEIRDVEDISSLVDGISGGRDGKWKEIWGRNREWHLV
jgi:hypothetical protein